jgi:hypothetical protein
MVGQTLRTLLCIVVSSAALLDSLIGCFYAVSNWLLFAWTIDTICMKTIKTVKDSDNIQYALYFVCISAKLCYLILVISDNADRSRESKQQVYDNYDNNTNYVDNFMFENAIGFAICLCIFFMSNTTILLFDMAQVEDTICSFIAYNTMVSVEAASMTAIVLMLQNCARCMEIYSPRERQALFICSIVQIAVAVSPVLEFFILVLCKCILGQNNSSSSSPLVLPSAVSDIESLPENETPPDFVFGPRIESGPDVVVGPAGPRSHEHE